MGSKSSPPILLVIDLQQGLVEPAPSEGNRSTPDLTTNVTRILKHFRQHSWPIIHINHDDHDVDHPLNKLEHPETFAPHACAAPQENEPVLLKHGGSSFVDPELGLAKRLTALGGKGADVVIVGMDGAQCVNDNTRAANDLGFKVTVVADACASFGMPDYRNSERFIGPEETHTAAMSMLANGFAKVLGTEEFLRER